MNVSMIYTCYAELNPLSELKFHEESNFWCLGWVGLGFFCSDLGKFLCVILASFWAEFSIASILLDIDNLGKMRQWSV